MSKFMTYVTVQLLLIKDNKVLLMKRQNTGYEDGKYGFVGGHLEEGEDFKTTIIREAKEELNIELERKKLKFSCLVHRSGVTKNYVNIFFVTDCYSGKMENKEVEKCSEIVWRDIHNLPDNIIEIEKRVLENYGSNNFLIEYGW